jgi:hypothetical protein
MIYQKSLAEKGEVIIDDILKDYGGIYSPCPKSKSPFKRKKGFLVEERGDIERCIELVPPFICISVFQNSLCILHLSGVAAN